MKKAIVVVSCGTSYEKTLERAIGGCENRIREAFSDYDVRRAFTSNTAIGKLEKRDNIHVDTVEEALGKLKDQGYSEVIVQSLHIINGDEHDKVKEQASAFHNQFDRLIIGEPLLTDRQDYEIVIAALFSQIPVLEKDEAVVFMGQGSGHYSFSAYACLDHMLRDTPMFLACMESYPELDIIIGELEEKDKKKVH